MDSNYVALPYLSGQKWGAVKCALNKDIRSVEALQKAVCSYNSKPISFVGFQRYLDTLSGTNEDFFGSTLPPLIRYCLQLPDLCREKIPVLQKKQPQTVYLSQKQIGCLLVNAFFCTLEERHLEGISAGFGDFPDINFNRLLSCAKHPHNVEKFTCLFHYFKRIIKEVPNGTVSFARLCLNEDDVPDFESSAKVLSKVGVNWDKSIEDLDDHARVDFADKYIGGQVLSLGCVQEEIMFMAYPELLVSRLFTHVMTHTEAVVVKGVEKFNVTMGYSKNFKWVEPFYDQSLRDSENRRTNHIICIDATSFNYMEEDQYFPHHMKREMVKAFCGFQPMDDGDFRTIATGNWGCGIFKGNPRLKFLLQLIAAVEAGRELNYCTFGDENLAKSLMDINDFLVRTKTSVGDLTAVLFELTEGSGREDLYKYIKRTLKRNKMFQLMVSCCF